MMRNTPLLLQLLFWYNAVLKALPGPRQSLSLDGVAFLNNRGLYLPRPEFAAGARRSPLAFARRRRGGHRLRGLRAPAPGADRANLAGRLGSPTLAILAPPILAYFLPGRPIGFSFAELKASICAAALQLYPEFVALVFGLVTYTAGFIAEIVRAGVNAVSHGQTEAAAALGLPRGRTLASSSCRRRCGSSFRR